MQNSSRKLGEFTALVAQLSEEVKCLCEKCPKENTLPFYFRVLEDHYTCSAVHDKFGSGLTCNEQNVRYTF